MLYQMNSPLGVMSVKVSSGDRVRILADARVNGIDMKIDWHLRMATTNFILEGSNIGWRLNFRMRVSKGQLPPMGGGLALCERWPIPAF